MQLELINEPLKVTQPTIIADLEDTMVTIGKRSRMFPVKDFKTNEIKGYYIVGDIYLGADTIVITEQGAVGDPIEKLAREAFVSNQNIDLSNAKPDNVSEKDFRKIELDAYRNFQKMEKFGLEHKKIVIEGIKFHLSKKIAGKYFFVYLFNPEEFILVKERELLIALSDEDRAIIICNKAKNSYVEVSKSQGVKISNQKGETINANSTNGLVINGRGLDEIIFTVFDNLKNVFQ